MINISELIQRQESYWEDLKQHQCMDEKSMWYGGFNYAYEFAMTKIITQGLPLYCEAGSRYYKSEDILERMKLNSEFLLKYQNDSGLISLLDCNIESPPDTAFMVNDLAIAHFYIERSKMTELKTIDENIVGFLRRTQNGLINGGFHTPNHRWVISCALGMLYNIFGNEELKKRAHEYIAEGIDINDDGEWTERSNACYNAVSDLYMYHIGEIFHIDEAFEAVRKNLEMMKFLLHPNDYIVTEYSTRQDKGKVATMDARYTIAYMLTAGKYNEPEFVYMAERAIEHAKEFGGLLQYARLYEEYILADIEPKPVSDKYIKMINSGSKARVPKPKSAFGDSVLRYRNGSMSVTVMAGQPDFLFFQYGDARIFGIRSVAVYKGNFNAMPNDSREDIGKVEFSAECIIELKDDGIDLDISAGGHFLFTQLVCMFDRNGKLEGDDLKSMNEWVVRQNSGRSVYTDGGSEIEVTGGGSDHDLGVIRGDSLNKEAQNLVFNFISPEHRKIMIRHL